MEGSKLAGLEKKSMFGGLMECSNA